MDPTALSVTAREVRTFLAEKLDLSEAQIAIGHPGAAARQQETSSPGPQDLLNLFFYRVEYDGPADGRSDDPFYVRAHCLITAFCVADAAPNGASAGEKDLRAIGGVLHWLHAKPFVHVRSGGGTEVALLQTVPTSLALEDINHIWATQGELPYRLSVSYEFALLPMPLATPVARQPRVGGLRLGIGQDGPARLGFQVPPVRVATEDNAWEPAIRFVDPDGALGYALSYTTAEAPEAVLVVGAGAPGTSVDLVWDRWDASTGWRSLGVASDALELRTRELDPEKSLPQPTPIALPDRTKGQLQLIAERKWRRPDGAVVVVRSNPLLVSFHDGAP